MAPQRQVPALCPSPPFPGTHACPPHAQADTRVLSPGFLGRSPCSGVGRQSQRREQAEERVSDGVGKESARMVAVRTALAWVR